MDPSRKRPAPETESAQRPEKRPRATDEAGSDGLPHMDSRTPRSHSHRRHNTRIIYNRHSPPVTYNKHNPPTMDMTNFDTIDTHNPQTDPNFAHISDSNHPPTTDTNNLPTTSSNNTPIIQHSHKIAPRYHPPMNIYDPPPDLMIQSRYIPPPQYHPPMNIYDPPPDIITQSRYIPPPQYHPPMNIYDPPPDILHLLQQHNPPANIANTRRDGQSSRQGPLVSRREPYERQGASIISRHDRFSRHEPSIRHGSSTTKHNPSTTNRHNNPPTTRLNPSSRHGPSATHDHPKRRDPSTTNRHNPSPTTRHDSSTARHNPTTSSRLNPSSNRLNNPPSSRVNTANPSTRTTTRNPLPELPPARPIWADEGSLDTISSSSPYYRRPAIPPVAQEDPEALEEDPVAQEEPQSTPTPQVAAGVVIKEEVTDTTIFHNTTMACYDPNHATTNDWLSHISPTILPTIENSPSIDSTPPLQQPPPQCAPLPLITSPGPLQEEEDYISDDSTVLGKGQGLVLPVLPVLPVNPTSQAQKNAQGTQSQESTQKNTPDRENIPQGAQENTQDVQDGESTQPGTPDRKNISQDSRGSAPQGSSLSPITIEVYPEEMRADMAQIRQKVALLHQLQAQPSPLEQLDAMVEQIQEEMTRLRTMMRWASGKINTVGRLDMVDMVDVGTEAEGVESAPRPQRRKGRLRRTGNKPPSRPRRADNAPLARLRRSCRNIAPGLVSEITGTSARCTRRQGGAQVLYELGSNGKARKVKIKG